MRDVDDGMEGEGFTDKENALRYKSARKGDHLMCSFQCDTCHFRNMEGRDPSADRVADQALLMHIRRAVLDSFWSREPGTVEGNLREGRKAMRMAGSMGMSDPFAIDRGPYPIADVDGMGLAVLILS